MSTMSTANTKVYFRVLPLGDMNWDYITVKNRKTVFVRKLQELSRHVSKNQNATFWQFQTNGVFVTNTQEQVYQTITEGFFDKIGDGFIAVIMAFGQTGSGKSFTIAGLNYIETSGLLPRLIADLFRTKKSVEADLKMSIKMSYIEVRNSHIIADLLRDYPIQVPSSKLVKRVKLESEYHALKLLYKGEGRKEFAFKDVNYLSHLGTSVVTFEIGIQDNAVMNAHEIITRIHVIDLAGVDTVGNASAVYKRPKEIGSANLVKSTLEQFLLYLQTELPGNLKCKQKIHPLIYYLGDDLSTENFLRFIGHIRTATKEDLQITLSMLRFSQIISGLKPSTKKNLLQNAHEEVHIEYLKRQLEKLEKEKLLNSVLLQQNLSENLTHERLEHIQRTVIEFVHNKTNEINLLNVADITATLNVFRDIYLQSEEEKNKTIADLQLKESMKSPRSRSIRSKTSSSSKASSQIKRMSDKSVLTNASSKELIAAVKSPTLSGLKTPSLSLSKSGSTEPKRSSTLIKRSSGRKKSLTNALDKQGSSHSIPEPLIPETVPEFKDAWISFIHDNETNFRKIIDEYVTNEETIKSIYIRYLTEIKTLNSIKDAIKVKEHILLQARMFKNFNSGESVHCLEETEEPPDKEIQTSAEKVCETSLKLMHEELLSQQEDILKIQAELKLHLNMREMLKETLHADFDDYCNNKFRMVVPNLDAEDYLQEHTVDVLQENIGSFVDAEDFVHPPVDNKIIQFRKLKNIMAREIKFKDAYKLSKMKWANTFVEHCHIPK